MITHDGWMLIFLAFIVGWHRLPHATASTSADTSAWLACAQQPLICGNTHVHCPGLGIGIDGESHVRRLPRIESPSSQPEKPSVYFFYLLGFLPLP